MEEKTSQEYICRNCEKPYFASRRNYVFCSKECMRDYHNHSPEHKAIGRKYMKTHRPMYKHTCLNCGRETLSGHKIRKFCSLECYYEYKRKPNTRFCETCGKEILRRDKKIRFCSKECYLKSSNNRVTNLEKALYELLESLGIEFERQKGIHRTVPDAFVPSFNLCIYVDGEYWHSSEKSKERDIRIANELIEEGYNVIRILSVENKIDFTSLKERLGVE